MSVIPFVKGLADKLFEPELRRLKNQITEMNARNKHLSNLSVDGFLFAGQFYMPSNVSTIISGPGQAKSTLHFSLNGEMEAWLRDRKIIQDDQDLIRQVLFIMLKPCQSNQAIRDVLPECLVSLIPGLGSYSRMDPEAYTILEDPRAMRQYERLLPRMMLYCATRLLY